MRRHAFLPPSSRSATRLLAVIGVLLAGAGCTSGHTRAAAHGPTTSTTVRTCLLMPYATRPEGAAPDGTYLVRIVAPAPDAPDAPDSDASVDLYLDDSSAGYNYATVPVSGRVEVRGAGAERTWTSARNPSTTRARDAIRRVDGHVVGATISDGVVTTIDLVHHRWDTTADADDPCLPSASPCMRVGEGRPIRCEAPG
jgi:hypothetical protein